MPAETWRELAAGWLHTCGAALDGTVTCWGSDDEGQASAPAGSFTGVVAGFDHSCARSEVGAVTCWGAVGLKPKKDGTKWNWTPEAIPELKGIKHLALGGGTQYAVMPDGTVSGWGSNAFNTLAQGKGKDPSKLAAAKELGAQLLADAGLRSG